MERVRLVCLRLSHAQQSHGSGPMHWANHAGSSGSGQLVARRLIKGAAGGQFGAARRAARRWRETQKALWKGEGRGGEWRIAGGRWRVKPGGVGLGLSAEEKGCAGRQRRAKRDR